ncbi:hypothetical protein BDW66DRAFT_40803 [Aspergillus desertorum]
MRLSIPTYLYRCRRRVDAGYFAAGFSASWRVYARQITCRPRGRDIRPRVPEYPHLLWNSPGRKSGCKQTRVFPAVGLSYERGGSINFLHQGAGARSGQWPSNLCCISADQSGRHVTSLVFQSTSRGLEICTGRSTSSWSPRRIFSTRVSEAL